MPINIEQEVKLQVPRRFDLSALAAGVNGYTTSPVEAHRYTTVYYDTDDLRLARWGCSLRYRRGQGWTLKLPGQKSASSLRRVEHTFLDEVGAKPPAQALELVTAYLRGKPVAPVARLRTMRKSLRLHGASGEDLAEVVDDDVRVMQDGHVADRFRQVEVELLDGAPESLLTELTQWLQDAGAGSIDETPKSVRALGDAAKTAPELHRAKPTASSPASDVVRYSLATAVERLLRSDAALRLTMDPEVVHLARVATRRLRSDLRSFMPILDEEWARSLRERVKWLGDELGLVRDADVLVARLHHDAAQLPSHDAPAAEAVIDRFAAQSVAARQELRKILREQRYVELLDELVDAVADPKLAAHAGAPAQEALPSLVRVPWKKLCKTVAALAPEAGDEKLHEVRIKAKRCRYAAEAIAEVGGKTVARFARRVEKLQRILGDLHDAVAAEQRLRGIRGDSDEVFVAGGLAAMEAQAANDARGSWRKAWKKASKKNIRFWS
jgi:CHAD domain-containing protein